MTRSADHDDLLRDPDAVDPAAPRPVLAGGPSSALGRTALLVEDPDLAIGVPSADRQLVERVVVVPLLECRPGPLHLEERPNEPTLGIIVLDGFLTATTTFAGHSTAQLLGPGSLLQGSADDAGLLPVQITHQALTPLRLAVLDRRFIAAVRRWPSLLLALHERQRQQQWQLAIHAAIGRLRRNEDRVLAMLWQIAEQWGHVTNDGVTLPLKLTHAELGRIAGASRPTTSLALSALEHEGRLRRGDQAQLILDPDSSMILARATELTPRRLRPAGASVKPELDPKRTALLDRVAALQSGFDERVRNVDEILAASRACTAQNAESRRRLQSERLARRSAP